MRRHGSFGFAAELRPGLGAGRAHLGESFAGHLDPRQGGAGLGGGGNRCINQRFVDRLQPGRFENGGRIPPPSLPNRKCARSSIATPEVQSWSARNTNSLRPELSSGARLSRPTMKSSLTTILRPKAGTSTATMLPIAGARFGAVASARRPVVMLVTAIRPASASYSTRITSPARRLGASGRKTKFSNPI